MANHATYQKVDIIPGFCDRAYIRNDYVTHLTLSNVYKNTKCLGLALLYDVLLNTPVGLDCKDIPKKVLTSAHQHNETDDKEDSPTAVLRQTGLLIPRLSITVPSWTDSHDVSEMVHTAHNNGHTEDHTKCMCKSDIKNIDHFGDYSVTQTSLTKDTSQWTVTSSHGSLSGKRKSSKPINIPESIEKAKTKSSVTSDGCTIVMRRKGKRTKSSQPTICTSNTFKRPCTVTSVLPPADQPATIGPMPNSTNSATINSSKDSMVEKETSKSTKAPQLITVKGVTSAQPKSTSGSVPNKLPATATRSSAVKTGETSKFMNSAQSMTPNASDEIPGTVTSGGSPVQPTTVSYFPNKNQSASAASSGSTINKSETSKSSKSPQQSTASTPATVTSLPFELRNTEDRTQQKITSSRSYPESTKKNSYLPKMQNANQSLPLDNIKTPNDGDLDSPPGVTKHIATRSEETDINMDCSVKVTSSSTTNPAMAVVDRPELPVDGSKISHKKENVLKLTTMNILSGIKNLDDGKNNDFTTEADEELLDRYCLGCDTCPNRTESRLDALWPDCFVFSSGEPISASITPSTNFLLSQTKVSAPIPKVKAPFIKRIVPSTKAIPQPTKKVSSPSQVMPIPTNAGTPFPETPITQNIPHRSKHKDSQPKSESAVQDQPDLLLQIVNEPRQTGKVIETTEGLSTIVTSERPVGLIKKTQKPYRKVRLETPFPTAKGKLSSDPPEKPRKEPSTAPVKPMDRKGTVVMNEHPMFDAMKPAFEVTHSNTSSPADPLGNKTAPSHESIELFTEIFEAPKKASHNANTPKVTHSKESVPKKSRNSNTVPLQDIVNTFGDILQTSPESQSKKLEFSALKSRRKTPFPDSLRKSDSTQDAKSVVSKKESSVTSADARYLKETVPKISPSSKTVPSNETVNQFGKMVQKTPEGHSKTFESSALKLEKRTPSPNYLKNSDSTQDAKSVSSKKESSVRSTNISEVRYLKETVPKISPSSKTVPSNETVNQFGNMVQTTPEGHSKTLESSALKLEKRTPSPNYFKNSDSTQDAKSVASKKESSVTSANITEVRYFKEAVPKISPTSKSVPSQKTVNLFGEILQTSREGHSKTLESSALKLEKKDLSLNSLKNSDPTRDAKPVASKKESSVTSTNIPEVRYLKEAVPKISPSSKTVRSQETVNQFEKMVRPSLEGHSKTLESSALKLEKEAPSLSSLKKSDPTRDTKPVSSKRRSSATVRRTDVETKSILEDKGIRSSALKSENVVELKDKLVERLIDDGQEENPTSGLTPSKPYEILEAEQQERYQVKTHDVDKMGSISKASEQSNFTASERIDIADEEKTGEDRKEIPDIPNVKMGDNESHDLNEENANKEKSSDPRIAQEETASKPRKGLCILSRGNNYQVIIKTEPRAPEDLQVCKS